MFEIVSQEKGERMSRKHDDNTQKAFKLAEKAIELESNNCNKEAYVKYLQSISSITSHLLCSEEKGNDYAESSLLTTVQIGKLVLVARQCLDRIETLLPKLEEVNHCTVTGRSNEEVPSSDENLTSPLPSITAKVSRLPFASNKPCARKNNSILELIDWVSPEESVIDAEFIVEQDLSPLEKAKKDNELLMENYQARLRSALPEKAQANLRLELQRRMAENIQVARRKQNTYVEQVRKQNRHRLDKVTQSMKQTGSSTSKLLPVIRETLDYEENQRTFARLHRRLEESQDVDVKLLQVVVNKTLQDEKHPLAKQLLVYAQNIDEKIRLANALEENNNVTLTEPTLDERQGETDEVLQVEETGADATTIEDFKDAYKANANDVSTALVDTQKMISVLKEELEKSKDADLNCRRSKSEVAVAKMHFKDIIALIQNSVSHVTETFALVYGKAFEADSAKMTCCVQMEEHFYPVFWSSLMALCRSLNRKEEAVVMESMKKLQDCSLSDLGYGGRSPSATYDCKDVVKMLKQLVALNAPTKKLESLVQVVKLICKKCPPTTESSNNAKSISADDLIPLLSFVCIRTAMPELVSESSLLESLIHQKNLMGEEGYCLTSLQTALQYIQTMEAPSTFQRLESTV